MTALRVFLRDVMVEASIGLHPWERHPERKSRLIVNVEMMATVAGRPGSELMMNYDILREAIRQWPYRPHVDLLETLAGELVDLCFENAAVDACRVSVQKPDIFNEAAGAGVELSLNRAEYAAWQR
jgi:dihydroneopterin aldolase